MPGAVATLIMHKGVCFDKLHMTRGLSPLSLSKGNVWTGLTGILLLGFNGLSLTGALMGTLNKGVCFDKLHMTRGLSP